jgi:hypothetical protein
MAIAPKTRGMDPAEQARNAGVVYSLRQIMQLLTAYDLTAYKLGGTVSRLKVGLAKAGVAVSGKHTT